MSQVTPGTPRQSVVVGIDFGTTYSGLAWALCGGDNSVEIVSTWPGGRNRTSPKTPTTMSYGNNAFSWGFQTTRSEQVIRGIKLLLDPDQEMNYQPSLEAKKLLNYLRKTPGEVTAKYLEELVGHVKGILKRRFGPVADEMDLKFVLTVPAIWSDKAKDVTLRSAVWAGIPADKLSLLSEPESAALYALRTIQPNTVQKQDVIIVCDAGGGTVDLISYRVDNVSPLKLEEIVEGTGGVCGSMILDERFEDFLEDTLSTDRFEKLSLQARDAARNYWLDTVKPNFDGNENDDFEELEWAVPLPGAQDDPSIDLEGNFLRIDKSQVQGIFDPVIQEVIDLVRGQIKSIKGKALCIKAILLVGGFGASEYLYRRLTKAYPKITIMQPPNAWQAVVHGAVLRGLDGNVIKSRQARGHYGISCSSLYDRMLHDRSERYFCHYDDVWKAKDQMKWFINKGSSISEDKPIRLGFRTFQYCHRSSQTVFHQQLFFSASSTAPQRKSRDVTKLCAFDVDLSAIPKNLFEKRTNGAGASYYKIKYHLVLIPTSAYLYFQLEFNGVSYGSVQAQY